MQIYKCPFDQEVLVFEIEASDSGPMVDQLEKSGLGYALFGDGVAFNSMVVDGRIRTSASSQVYIDAIMAHELGHIHNLSECEHTAEKYAIDLLNKAGLKKSANFLLNRGIV